MIKGVHERASERVIAHVEVGARFWENGLSSGNACMKQLNTTGYMHNRGRLISSNFLKRMLGLDWGTVYRDHSLLHSFIRSLANLLAHSLVHLLGHLLIAHSLSHSFARSLTYSLMNQ